jgi:hypothetical protein
MHDRKKYSLTLTLKDNFATHSDEKQTLRFDNTSTFLTQFGVTNAAGARRSAKHSPYTSKTY